MEHSGVGGEALVRTSGWKDFGRVDEHTGPVAEQISVPGISKPLSL